MLSWVCYLLLKQGESVTSDVRQSRRTLTLEGASKAGGERGESVTSEVNATECCTSAGVATLMDGV
jgi:hypothetical protein